MVRSLRGTLTTLGTRGLPVVLAVSLLPRLVLPVGSVLCIETCGTLAIAAPHASHACHHSDETAPESRPAGHHHHGHGHAHPHEDEPGHDHGHDHDHHHGGTPHHDPDHEHPSTLRAESHVPAECLDVEFGSDIIIRAAERTTDLGPLDLALTSIGEFRAFESGKAVSAPSPIAVPLPPRLSAAHPLPLRV